MDLRKLISGSDIRGKAVGEDAQLTPEVAQRLGTAFALFLAEKKAMPLRDVVIGLGRDSRITGPALLKAVADGVIRTGASVQEYGMCTTPAMFMSTVTPGFAPVGAVMITASHHPWDRNGLKFVTADGGLEHSEIEKLITLAETTHADVPAEEAGCVCPMPFLPTYKRQLADRVRKGLATDAEKPLQGLHVVVDAGNGAGGFYADLMAELGACVDGSQFLDPDGMFPNHRPNPEDPTAMAAVSKAVIHAGADLGVIFDADCDRAAVVDADGREINRNRLIALMSAILLAEKPGQTIVTDSVTSSGLHAFISARGGEHYRYKRGYRNVIDEAIRLNKQGASCPLAIETSGHAALQENHFLDDGMYLVTVLIVEAMKLKRKGKTLGALIADLKEPVESTEIRLGITAEDFRTAGQKAIDKVLAYAGTCGAWHIAPDNREGVRISFDLDGGADNGWFLLRLSVHDPVLPLNAESDIPGGVRQMLAALYDVIKDCEGLDLSALVSAIR